MNSKVLFAIKKNEDDESKRLDIKGTKFKIVKKRLPWTLEVTII